MAIDLKAFQQDMAMNNISTVSTDSLGFSVLPSDVYNARVIDAYFIVSQSGSTGLNLKFSLFDDDNKELQEYSETIYFTSSKTKSTFYVDKTGKKKGLPGFYSVNDFCLITTGKELSACVTSPKEIQIETGGQTVNQVVDVLHESLGAFLKVGIQEVEKNKFLDGMETDEVVKVNNINKFFCATDGRTIKECIDNKPASFINEWINKYKNKVINKVKKINNNVPPGVNMNQGQIQQQAFPMNSFSNFTVN